MDGQIPSENTNVENIVDLYPWFGGFSRIVDEYSPKDTYAPNDFDRWTGLWALDQIASANERLDFASKEFPPEIFIIATAGVAVFGEKYGWEEDAFYDKVALFFKSLSEKEVEDFYKAWEACSLDVIDIPNPLRPSPGDVYGSIKLGNPTYSEWAVRFDEDLTCCEYDDMDSAAVCALASIRIAKNLLRIKRLHERGESPAPDKLYGGDKGKRMF